jgi:hypothetical protein
MFTAISLASMIYFASIIIPDRQNGKEKSVKLYYRYWIISRKEPEMNEFTISPH